MAAPILPHLLLVGVNGYGHYYVNAVLDLQAQGAVRIAGIVDPTAARCDLLPQLTANGAPVLETVEAFYAGGGRADLACIASPIQFHCVQTCAALAGGSSVLCEKPLGALVEEAERMAAAERLAGRFVAIGYQWSYSRAIQSLKADVLSGRLGAPLRLRTRVLWPRGSHYYSRNDWAGRIKDGAGRWVLDSPANNATAHYLHNMLYVLGDRVDTSARPLRVTAELYRANPVETFDTCALRIRTDRGVEVLFYTSHATRESTSPEFIFEFEKGTVRFSERPDGAQVIGTMADGSTCHYGDPAIEPRAKLNACLAAVRDPSRGIACGVQAARMHTACINALRDVPVVTFAPTQIDRHRRENGDVFTFVPGLTEMLGDAYEHGALPSERGAPLATSAVTVDLQP